MQNRIASLLLAHLFCFKHTILIRMFLYCQHLLRQLDIGMVQVISHWNHFSQIITIAKRTCAYLSICIPKQLSCDESWLEQIGIFVHNSFEVFPIFDAIIVILFEVLYDLFILKHFYFFRTPYTRKLHIRQNLEIGIPIALLAQSPFI